MLKGQRFSSVVAGLRSAQQKAACIIAGANEAALLRWMHSVSSVTNKRWKIGVAVSGGVDSAVAALLLKRQGCETAFAI